MNTEITDEKIELMTPDEWAQKMRDKLVFDFEQVALKHEGRSDDVLLPMIKRFREATGTEQINLRIHRNAVKFAVEHGDPVSLVAVAAYGIKLS